MNPLLAVTLAMFLAAVVSVAVGFAMALLLYVMKRRSQRSVTIVLNKRLFKQRIDDTTGEVLYFLDGKCMGWEEFTQQFAIEKARQ